METKGLLQSKINWIGIILVVLGALESVDWTQVLDKEVAGYIVSAIGVILMVVRTFWTKTKLQIKV